MLYITLFGIFHYTKYLYSMVKAYRSLQYYTCLQYYT